MPRFISSLLYGIIWIISLIPLPVMYLISDIAWLFMFICPPLRYRRKIVRKNLALSFPEKDRRWLRRTERRFYYQFLCQIMESLKTASVSERWIKRHMEITGCERIVEQATQGRSGFGYLGHVGNWEWIPSMMLYFKDVDNFMGGQVYHKLENRTMDLFMLKLRSKFGTENIQMEHIMRRLLECRNSGKSFFIGMIADQVPLYWNTHYWTQFMNQHTPVFTGTERISRKLDAQVWYMKITRKRRGYYRCDITMMFDHTKDLPQFEVTERYMRLLEENIRECPELWLWTHNRWKRDYEGYRQWLLQHQNAERPRD